MDIKINYHSSICINGEIFVDPLNVGGGAAKWVFLTHDHYDHYSPKDIEKLLCTGTVIICPKSFAENVKARFSCEVVAVEQKGEYEVAGLRFETFPAYNLDKPFHPKEKGYVGYVLLLEGQRVVVAGDTDATSELLATRPDILLLPVGGTFTMDYRQAAEAAKKMKPRLAIPTHYGSIVGSPKDGQNFKKLVQGEMECRVLL